MLNKSKLFVLSIITCIVIISGCSSSTPHSTSSSEQAAYSGGEMGPAAGFAADQVFSEAEEAIQHVEAQSEAANLAGDLPLERKIIREQYIEQQVQDLAGVLDTLEKSITQIQGAYVESLREWKREEREQTIYNAEIIMRIPVDSFPAFLSQVEEQGHIIDRHVSGQDVTEEFVDNEARLRNLKRHEERILQLYEKAETIEEMLQIEQELTRIRSSIEQIEGRQKYLNQVTSTAKLTLQLFEVEKIDYLANQADTSIFQEAGLGFQKSIIGILTFTKRAFVWLITALPYLLGIAVLFIPSLFIARKMIKSSKKHGQD